jgi:hypothetical protein
MLSICWLGRRPIKPAEVGGGDNSTTLLKTSQSDEAEISRRQLIGGTPGVVMLWQASDHQVCGYAQARISLRVLSKLICSGLQERTTVQMVSVLRCLNGSDDETR